MWPPRVQILALAAMAFRIVGWNPMSVIRAGRQDQIGLTWPRIDAILMAGTRVRMPLTTPCSVSQRCWPNNAKSLLLDWGFGPGGQHTNRACGVRIQLRGDRYKKDHIVNVWSPPAGLQGRAGACRIRNNTIDAVLVVFYAPPKVMLAKKQKHYQTTVYRLFDWIRKVMS